MGNRSLGSLLVAALSFGYLVSFPLAIGRADESHLLYAAKRVLDGEAPYKDFFESVTPLGLYLFAGIFRAGGTTLLVARVGMALVEAVGCAVLFDLVRRVSGVAEAAIASLIFVGINIPTWPYASPHWISTTLGLLVAAVTLSERWQESHRARPLAAGMLAGAAACVQQQRGVFLVAWVAFALSVLALASPRPRRWPTQAREVMWAAAGTTLVVLTVLGYAAWRASPAAVADQVLGFAVKHYGPTFSGRTPWAGVQPLTQVWRASTWLWLLRVSPLFLVGEGVLLLRRGRRLRERPELTRVCFWLLALLMALSVWYMPDFIHVSFVLPFLLIPAASLVHRLRFAALWARLPAGRRIVHAAMWLLGGAVLGECVANLAYARALAPARLHTGFGVVQGDAVLEQLFHAVRSHLVQEPDGRSLLYSYPDDAWLYLTLPADDATRFSVLLPGFFPPEDIAEVVGVVRARRPGTVVLAIPLLSGAVPEAVQEGYDAVTEVPPYRIYVRRDAHTKPSPAATP
jgi:hypothetical protein